MKNNIVIIGTGNIGKRHLQAVGNLKMADGVVCYDNIEASLNSVHPFCKANNIDAEHLDIRADYKNTLDAITPGSIVVIATTAKGRKDILLDVIAKRPKAVIAEKPLCQSDEEYKQILAASKAGSVPVYVNLTRHSFDVYKRIKREIIAAKERIFVSVFPDGMSCIGIHIFDLMTWLFDAKTQEISSSTAFGLTETKRGGCFDFYGDMSLLLDNRDAAFFRAAQKDCVFSVKISTEDKEYNVFEYSKKMVITDRSGEVRTEEIEVPFVSQTTSKIVAQIMEGEKPDLPTVEESYLAHKILFDYMRKNSLEGVNIA